LKTSVELTANQKPFLYFPRATTSKRAPDVFVY
jgi:hypothetical protein